MVIENLQYKRVPEQNRPPYRNWWIGRIKASIRPALLQQAKKRPGALLLSVGKFLFLVVGPNLYKWLTEPGMHMEYGVLGVSPVLSSAPDRQNS